MRRLINKGQALIFSQTAKDTYLVMTANAANGATGLILSILIARNLMVADFGIFSSLLNLVLILVAIVDLGMMQGVVNFVSRFIAERKNREISHYLGTMIGFVFSFGFIALVFLQIIPGGLVEKIAGTSNRIHLLMAGLAVITFSLYPFCLAVFQSYRKFLPRTVIEILFDGLRIGFLFLLIISGLTVGRSVLTYVLGAVVIFPLIWKLWPSKKVEFNLSWATFKKIFKFSRWLWLVNMIINLYGRMDVLILTALTTSLIVGKYAAAARLALVFPMVVNALNSVISPRFASFSDRTANLSYIKKSFLLSLIAAFGLMMLALFAKPLVLAVYGERYLDAVGIFRLLVIANLPLVLTVPAGNSLIYFFKKPKAISFITLIQLFTMGVTTYSLVPRFSAYAPVYGFIIANLLGLILIYSTLFKFQFTRKQ